MASKRKRKGGVWKGTFIKSVGKLSPNVGNDDGIIPAGTLVWKQCRVGTNGIKRVLVSLLVVEPGIVPTAARRHAAPYSSMRTRARPLVLRKCRVRAALVLSIEPLPDWGRRRKIRELDRTTVCRSGHDPSFKYKVGEIVRPKHEFSDDPEDACKSGIHVFRTKAEAIVW